MAAAEQCPHDHQTIANGGPYYRQVHPNNFQDGRALSPAFVLQEPAATSRCLSTTVPAPRQNAVTVNTSNRQGANQRQCWK